MSVGLSEKFEDECIMQKLLTILVQNLATTLDDSGLCLSLYRIGSPIGIEEDVRLDRFGDSDT